MKAQAGHEGLPSPTYCGSSDRDSPLRDVNTGSSSSTPTACAPEPKELTTKMSRGWPSSSSLASAKIFSLMMEARAGKSMEETKMPMYRGSACRHGGVTAKGAW